MKLATYSKDGSVSAERRSVNFGILTETGLIDIVSALRFRSGQALDGGNPPRSVKEILERGPECLARLAELEESGAELLPVESVRLLAPIPRPGKILALAGNYTEHIKEGGGKLGLADSPRNTTVPRPFIMPSTAVANPGDEIPWAGYSETIDYELELGVVIGKKVKTVSIDDALDVIAGYTIVNDVSARTVTFKENRAERPWDEFYDWLNGKWADGFCPMGPYLLTADEIDDVQNLDMKLTVNGEVRQNANTSQMIHTVAQIVSFMSNLMTLEPGDIIATGTPSGVGFPTGNFLKAGDKIEASIEKLGTLTNSLGPKPESFYEPLT